MICVPGVSKDCSYDGFGPSWQVLREVIGPQPLQVSRETLGFLSHNSGEMGGGDRDVTHPSSYPVEVNYQKLFPEEMKGLQHEGDSWKFGLVLFSWW